MEGTRAKRGEDAVYAAGYLIGSSLHAKRAPAIEPVARLGASDGGNPFQGLLAIELFAVAPESRKSEGNQSP